ncbi:hypothetical protein FACS1894141_5320 [Spirochaetia bacterium]|nr:hypothetical protein FACS1894141_5320 [Spirochaetia bacterium]
MGLRTGLSFRFTPNLSLDLNVVGEIGFGYADLPMVRSKGSGMVYGSAQLSFAVGAELGFTFMLPY